MLIAGVVGPAEHFKLLLQNLIGVDFVQRNLIFGAVIEFRGTGRLMCGDLLACSKVPPSVGVACAIPAHRQRRLKCTFCGARGPRCIPNSEEALAAWSERA
jgi:hypothetical protein